MQILNSQDVSEHHAIIGVCSSANVVGYSACSSVQVF